MRNLAKNTLDNGGDISPLIIPSNFTNGTGLMNPSIFIDGDGILCNLRHVNYTLIHCEGKQVFGNRHGPLAYLNPENDLNLKTINFMLELNEDLSIKSYQKVDTSKCDVTPMWEFHGLEDARMVKWDNNLYITGVRRDTTPNGQGRMELSLLVDNKEYARYRIEAPSDKDSYCEKNWMPILDMPFHYVKWTNPTEIVKVDIQTLESETVILKEPIIADLQNMRGSSQVIRIGDFRVCIVHETALWKNNLQQRNARYVHRFVIWDLDWSIRHISEPFNFMDGEVEFCCGMALYKNDLLISFAFQDNAAYILKIPQSQIHSTIWS